MNELLAIKRVDSFARLLGAYGKAGIKLYDAIDGGAGFGGTAKEMLPYLEEGSRVFAFEPFPGNHRFFSPQNGRIQLIPKALGETSKRMKFHVPSVVTEDSAWGKKGMAGYSSVGYLVNYMPSSKNMLEVECVAADNVINSKISFVKLDLQGGELNALKGMRRIVKDALCMWVEFSGQKGLYSYLRDEGFVLFDTEYFFMGDSTEAVMQIFDVTKTNVQLSIGKNACFGFKKLAWNNFEAEFLQYKQELNLVQTDLVCVNRSFINQFVAATSYL